MRKLLQTANSRVTASMLVMGMGQLLYKQWGKGLMFLAVQLGYIYYLVTIGARDLFGFFTLGSVASNPWYGLEGDNSVIMLIMGVLAWIVTILYIVCYPFWRLSPVLCCSSFANRSSSRSTLQSFLN